MTVKFECSIALDGGVDVERIATADRTGEEVCRSLTQLSMEKAEAVAEFINQLKKD